LRHLSHFTALTDLILDKNKIDSLKSLECPVMASVETLWINNNELNSLEELLDVVTQKVSSPARTRVAAAARWFTSRACSSRALRTCL
jgi:hypothetical protein